MSKGSLHYWRICLIRCFVASVASLAISWSVAEAEDSVIPLAGWRDPPREARPVARWWWPGGSVDPAVLRRQLQEIRAAGFGAVEVQPLLLGIGSQELAADPRLRTVGTPRFAQLVGVATAAAETVGLDFDLTLGSGWPGGLPTPKRNAERQLLMATRDVEGPARFEEALPPAPDQSYRRAVEWMLDVLGPPDPDAKLVAVLAARLAGERAGVPILEDVRVITSGIDAGRLAWDVPPGSWRLFAFYENATGHFVMGGAFPGDEPDALVVDHLSRRGADALLEGYAAPILDAVPRGRIRELFVDSFELMGELPFTDELLYLFEAEKGYDLTPHLPLVFRSGGESKYAEMIDIFGRSGHPLHDAVEVERGQRIREDYEAVRALLFETRFIDRISKWARARDLGLRLQAHGGYADYLDVYARADVPEAEGLFAGGSSEFLKLAASSAHVTGRRWASSEAFITMRLYGTQLERDEMRLLAGRAYAAGINRLAHHGVPYPYTRADGQAWYPFSGGFGRILAGPFPMSSRIDSELLARLADFNLFLSRLSFVMAQGAPVADVAWLRADPVFPDSASLQLGRIEPHAGESAVTKALRARGLVHDRVSRKMLTRARAGIGAFFVGQQQYRALLLDPMEVAEPELVERIAAIAESGAPVLTLGELPTRAPGLRDASDRDRRVREAVSRLSKRVIPVSSEETVTALLARRVAGSLVEPVAGADLEVSLARRRSQEGETVLVFNESWSAHRARLRFVRDGRSLTRWDPRTGSHELLRESVAAGEVIEVELEAAETLILTLSLTE